MTFSEPVSIGLNEGGDFTVREALGNPYAVASTIGDVTLQDNQLELSVANFSAAVGDLTLLYTRASSTIDDFGGQHVASTGLDGISVNLDQNEPLIVSAEEINPTTLRHHF